MERRWLGVTKQYGIQSEKLGTSEVSECSRKTEGSSSEMLATRDDQDGGELLEFIWELIREEKDPF